MTLTSSGLSRRDLLRRAGGVGAVATAAALLPPTRAVAATDPADLSVLEALSVLQTGELSPTELLAACLARADRLEPVLRAFVTRTDASARERAADSDRRWAAGTARLLEGIPYGAKDIFYTAGVPTTAGARAYADFVPDTDATLVRRLDAAGAVMAGKTTTHEFAFGASTPPTRNPWDPTRHPGGSSGGTGAVVGGRVLPMGTGSDTLGSLRIPAAANGIVGIRPTFGLTSRHDVVPLAFSFDTTGVLARTVSDSALLFHLTVGSDPLDASTEDAGSAAIPLAGPDDLRGVRLGRPDRWFFDDVEPSIAARVEEALAVAVRLGAELVEVSLPPVFDEVMDPQAARELVSDGDAAVALLGPALSLPVLLAYAEAAGFHYRLRRERSGGYSADIQAVLQLAESVSAAGYLRAQQLRSVFVRDLGALLREQRLDAIVAPTLQQPREQQQSLPGSSGLLTGADGAHNSTPWSFNGFPSLSLPLGLDAVGMPVGLLLNGGPRGEAALYRVALALEQELDFRRHVPAVLTP